MLYHASVFPYVIDLFIALQAKDESDQSESEAGSDDDEDDDESKEEASDVIDEKKVRDKDDLLLASTNPAKLMTSLHGVDNSKPPALPLRFAGKSCVTSSASCYDVAQDSVSSTTSGTPHDSTPTPTMTSKLTSPAASFSATSSPYVADDAIVPPAVDMATLRQQYQQGASESRHHVMPSYTSMPYQDASAVYENTMSAAAAAAGYHNRMMTSSQQYPAQRHIMKSCEGGSDVMQGLQYPPYPPSQYFYPQHMPTYNNPAMNTADTPAYPTAQVAQYDSRLFTQQLYHHGNYQKMAHI